MITLRYRLKNLKVQAAEKEFKQGDDHLPGRLLYRVRRCGERFARRSRRSALQRWP